MTVHKPRVAIVRGPYLNPYEMQTYSLLESHFDLQAFATYDNQFDEDEIEFPISHLHRPKELGFDIPRWRGFCNVATRLICGSEERMLGLERALMEFDLIHAAETFNYFSLQAVRASAESSTPVVLTVWDNIPNNLEEIPRFAQCKREVRTGADCFAAVTEQARLGLMSEGVDASRIRVIGAGIDVDRFSPGDRDSGCCARFGLTGDQVVILFVGSLLKSKGVHDLLAATQLLHESNVLHSKTHRVLIIGRGPEEPQLRELARQLRIDDIVTLGGSVSYADMPEIHRLADIFVLPSIPTPTWEEQFGMVLAESMASGKAVVSTQSGSIPEVVGDTGVLVPPGDPNSLAMALHDLLHDDERRAKLGRAARMRVESVYSHRIVAQKIANIYHALI